MHESYRLRQTNRNIRRTRRGLRSAILGWSVIAAVLLPLWLLASAPAAAGVEPAEMLADPVLEARARSLFKEIRCLVCQSQSIDTSDADLARDMRILVREHIKAGESDQQILDYLVARYGDFVLLDPPVRPSTALLWFGPFLVLFAGGLAVVYFTRNRWKDPDAVPLSPDERTRINHLLSGDPTP